MKQNKNKNITKITSGALVLLLASGCYIGNSNAEGNITEAPDMSISDKESGSTKINNIADALNDKSKTTEKKESESSDEKQNSDSSSDEGSVAKPVDEEAKNVQPIVPDNSSNNKNNEEQNNINKDDNKENSAENAESQASKPDQTEEKQKETEKPEVNSKSGDENKDKAADKNKVEKESKGSNTNSKEEDKQTNTGKNSTSKSNQNKKDVQTVPGQGDDQDSKKLKNVIAGEINNIKALVNDGTWSDESVKAAKAKITNLEAFLLKGDLKDKDLAEVKSAINDIQINVLKKKIVKETNVVKNDDKKVVSNEKSNKLSQKTVIKSNTDNVQTGVGSLSSVLLTLGSSSLALFAGKKRK